MNGALMKSPKITVIMPSLNVFPYYRMCLDSVVHQTLAELEIICIDAGSTDGTLNILSEYAERDPRIRIINSPVKSYGYQVNVGLREALGEYIAIVETDDYIAPDMFESLYQTALDTARPDVVKAGFNRVIQLDEGSAVVPVYPVKAKTGDVFRLSDHYEILRGYPSIWACIYRKSFLKDQGIQMQELPGAGWADNLFLYRTMCEALRIPWVNQPLYYYRELLPGSSSILRDCSVPIDRMNDIKDYLDAHFPDERILNAVAYQRAVDYRRMILESPFHTEQDIQNANHMLQRFSKSVSVLGELMQRKRTLDNILQGCRKAGMIPTAKKYLRIFKERFRRTLVL